MTGTVFNFIRAGLLVAAFCIGTASTRAEDKAVSIDDVMQNVQQWAQENLDTNVLAELPKLDDPQVQDFFRELQEKFQGERVIDLAALRSTAQTILPLLGKNPDTQPFAAWLAAQMDYLDVAEEIRTNAPPPKMATNRPPVVLANPPAPQVREIWVRKIAKRPWPPEAKKYVDDLKPVFTEQKVPPQLVWLAEVESKFDRHAESPAGAAGLFQLMPQTAKRFGLSLWPRDQRFSPQRSASATAQYLNYLHGKFKDWRLTLAAYNAGEGTVQKLLKKYRAKNFDDIAPHLPAETQLYVPRVEAVIHEREGVGLQELSAS